MRKRRTKVLYEHFFSIKVIRLKHLNSEYDELVRAAKICTLSHASFIMGKCYLFTIDSLED